jgi:hypothetical protein
MSETAIIPDYKKETNPSYRRPPKPDRVTPYIKDYMKSIDEIEGDYSSGS